MLYRILVLLIFISLVSCATPIAPSGGPADREGPVLEFTTPETGTTNFKGRVFEFQFDEFVNRSTVRQAITVEPDLGINYDISWKRKKLIVEFEDSFPDSTTVILKLGTNISDTRNNKIASPITLAISTGDEIDSGEISGKILTAGNGRGAAEQRILLYREPIDLTKRATYQAQTDTSGAFKFSYLSEGNYKPVLVDDRNRNKIWDREIESAHPFYRDIVRLEKESADTLDVLYTAQIDSTAPKLQGVGLFSVNRMRLRFSESIKVQDNTRFEITDSLGNQYSTAYPLYISPKERFVLFAQSEAPLEEGQSYMINPDGVTDLSNNPVGTEPFSFTGTAQEDTTDQRIITANGENGLSQTDPFIVTYAAPITQNEITDSLVVIEGTVDFDDWPEIVTDQNRLIVNPQEEWIEGVEYQFLAWNPATQRRKMFEPEVWDSTEYGELEIYVNNVDSFMTHYVRVLGPEGQEVRSVKFNAETTISDLPPLNYTLILFRDENGNERWDRGSVTPYHMPERYYVQRGIRVQEGFTSEVNITFE